MKVEPMLLAKNTDDMTAISAMEAIIGPAQLLKGEKIDAYYALLGKVRDAVMQSNRSI